MVTESSIFDVTTRSVTVILAQESRVNNLEPDWGYSFLITDRPAGVPESVD